MKYTIEGFSQEELVRLNLSVEDAIILRWLVDFYHTNKMARVIIDGKEYFWVHYQTVIDELPILGINNRNTMARRFNKLVEAGILEKLVNKKEGNRTYFRIVNIDKLVSSEGGIYSKVEPSTQNEKVLLKSREGLYSKVERVSTQK